MNNAPPSKDDPISAIGPVLVVDDDEHYREQLRSVLENKGIQVSVHESGAHAIRYMQQQPWSWFPSLIYTDLVMDGMGGYQFIRRVQENYPSRSIPIIVVSRLRSSLDVNEAEAAGAAAYLIKPITTEHIYQSLKAAFQNEKKKMLVMSSDPYRQRRKTFNSVMR